MHQACTINHGATCGADTQPVLPKRPDEEAVGTSRSTLILCSGKRLRKP